MTWFIVVLLQEGPPLRGTEPQPRVASSINPTAGGICCYSSFPQKGLKQ